jgi:hypothetical protein
LSLSKEINPIKKSLKKLYLSELSKNIISKTGIISAIDTISRKIVKKLKPEIKISCSFSFLFKIKKIFFIFSITK